MDLGHPDPGARDALIPSAALLITGSSVAGYLISSGLSARNFYSYAAKTGASLTQVQAVVENERTISLRAVGGDREALAGLQAQWNTTDAVFGRALSTISVLQGLDPQVMASVSAKFREIAAEVSAVRQGVRTRQAKATAVDAVYTQLSSLASSPLLLNALVPRTLASPWTWSPHWTCCRPLTCTRAWSA
jgi:hypothetical protein